MKKITLIALGFLLVVACKKKEENPADTPNDVSYLFSTPKSNDTIKGDSLIAIVGDIISNVGDLNGYNITIRNDNADSLMYQINDASKASSYAVNQSFLHKLDTLTRLKLSLKIFASNNQTAETDWKFYYKP